MPSGPPLPWPPPRRDHRRAPRGTEGARCTGRTPLHTPHTSSSSQPFNDAHPHPSRPRVPGGRGGRGGPKRPREGTGRQPEPRGWGAGGRCGRWGETGGGWIPSSQACEDGIQPPPVSPQRPHRPPAPQPRGSGCRPVPSLGRFGPPRPPRPPGTRGRLGCGWASLKGWEEEEVCGVCSGVLPVQRAPSVPRGALRWSRRGGGHGRGGPEGTAAAAAAALGEGGVGGKGTDRKAEEKKAYSTRYSLSLIHI